MPLTFGNSKIYLNQHRIVLMGVAHNIHGFSYPRDATHIHPNKPVDLGSGQVAEIDPSSAQGWRLDLYNDAGNPIYHLVIIHLGYTPRAMTPEEKRDSVFGPDLTITISNSTSTDPLDFTFFQGTTTDPAPAAPSGSTFQSFF